MECQLIKKSSKLSKGFFNPGVGLKRSKSPMSLSGVYGGEDVSSGAVSLALVALVSLRPTTVAIHTYRERNFCHHQSLLFSISTVLRLNLYVSKIFSVPFIAMVLHGYGQDLGIADRSLSHYSPVRHARKAFFPLHNRVTLFIEMSHKRICYASNIF